MKSFPACLCRLWMLLAAFGTLEKAGAASGTEFTYQGFLTDDGVPANGIYYFSFDLHDTETGGTAIGFNTAAAVTVTGGVFTVTLDYGLGPFAGGSPRWLQIHAARQNQIVLFPLTPRQLLSRAPFSLHSARAANADALDGFAASSFALKNAANTFTEPLLVAGSGQAMLGATSSASTGTWLNLGNTSAPASRTYNIVSTGPDNSEGAGKLLFRDGGNNAVRLTLDADGDVGIGTTAPQGRLDVRLVNEKGIRLINDGNLVPGIEAYGDPADGLTGIMRIRNAVEVWPNAGGTQSGKIDVRNTGGAATITLEGSTGSAYVRNLSATNPAGATTAYLEGSTGSVRGRAINAFDTAGTVTASMDGATGILAARNLPAAKFASSRRDPRSGLDDLIIGAGNFAILDSISVNVPASGTLLFTATANILVTATGAGDAWFKLEETTGGPAVLLVETGHASQLDNIGPNVISKGVMTISWAVNSGPGTRTFRTALTNGTSKNVAVDTTTLLVQFVSGSL